MLLGLAESERASCREVHRVASAHLQKIQVRIAALVRMEKMLAHTLTECSGQPSAPCPVLDWLKTPERVSGLATTDNQKCDVAVIR
jgi:MerR family transcriptional regulator, mercuric resistance operon regulatory protein